MPVDDTMSYCLSDHRLLPLAGAEEVPVYGSVLVSAIHGIIHFDGRPVDRTELEGMVASAPYRGPDGTRCFMDGEAAFAHQAFHVTPESVNEQQPLLSPCRRWLLVADIRLDNRNELAGQLGLDRELARTMTDPDYVMQAWLKWRTQCVEHLTGDFVFAVWDREARTLFLARDQMGGFGVAWHRTGGAFLFSSEIEPIISHPRYEAEINEDAVLKTVAWKNLNPNETHWQDVYFLEPANYAVVSTTGTRKQCYWDVAASPAIRFRDECGYVEHFMALLDRIISDRMRCTGPVAVSLSGGNDSTLLAAAAGRRFADNGEARRLRSYSYVFDGVPVCDEREWIEPVVDKYGIEARFIDGNALTSLSDLQEKIGRSPGYLHLDVHSARTSALSKLAGRDGTRLLMDGHLGDALFGGRGIPSAEMLRDGRAGELIRLLYEQRRHVEFMRDIIRLGVFPFLPGVIRRMARRIQHRQGTVHVPGMIHERSLRLNAVLAGQGARVEGLDREPCRRARCASITQAMWASYAAVLRGPVHNRHGVELAQPYRDARLCLAILGYPADIVSHEGRHRRLQRLAMERILPKKTVARKGKANFLPMLYSALVNGVASEWLHNPLIVKHNWVSAAWLDDTVRGIGSSENRKREIQLGAYLHLEVWLRVISSQSFRTHS